MKYTYIIIAMFYNVILVAQCNVSKLELENNMIRYSMTEKFYENEDLENGLKNIYISANFYGDKSKTETHFIFEFVVSYFWTSFQKEMTPNKLYIETATGEFITLIAEEKSRNTFNNIKNIPQNIKSIECTFKLSKENLIQLSNELSKLVISDYKTGMTIDLSATYKGSLSEMILCVVK